MNKVTKAQYEKYKENGICVKCGKKKAEPGKVMCKECAEIVRVYHAETREWLKSIGYCPRCGKNKLFGDEKLCPECLADAAIKNKKSREKHYGSNHNYYVMDIARLKEKGLCRSCRKNKVVEGHTYCATCLAKKRERSRKYRQKKTGNYLHRSEWYSYGLCYHCGKPLDNDEKRLCNDCCEKIAKNFKGIRSTNAYWKADNQLLGGVSHG